MNVSIESPEMYFDLKTNQIWLAGREWIKRCFSECICLGF